MPRDSFSTHSATKRDTTPKVCATVAPPWSVVTRPDRSRSGSSAPPAHIAVPTASWTGVWWKWAKCSSASEPASQAAAPDSACEGPIMAVTVPAGTGALQHRPLWTPSPVSDHFAAGEVEGDTRDPGRGVRGEVPGGGRDVGRLPDPAQRERPRDVVDPSRGLQLRGAYR